MDSKEQVRPVHQPKGLAADAASDHAALSKALDFNSAGFFTVKPSELSVRGVLGSGAQAEVYKAEWTRSFAATSSSIIVAVKRLHSDLGPIYRDREALTLLTDHPNLVKCFDSTLDMPYLVITEYCAGGSLFDLLYNSPQELSLMQKVKVLTDVASGMKFLHSQKPSILHRDLKSSNVLLMQPIRSASQVPFAKVADFGLARISEVTNTNPLMTVGVGTWRWMAPEVLEDSDIGTYDKKADVFSYAMLMYEVLARKMPYADRFPADTCDPRIGLYVCGGLRPDMSAVGTEYPPVLTELLQAGWHAEPSDRPNFEELEPKLLEVLAAIPSPEGTQT